MEIKGVSYDVGRVMAGNWRPDFDPRVVQRELEIIRNDLHCNAVRICGLDINRLVTAAETALGLGLEVWLSPEIWDKGQAETLAYITRAAGAAEELRAEWPGRLVLLVGSELTLFMQGIVPGRNITQRMRNPSFRENTLAGKHNAPLNAFLEKANERVRQAFHGKVSYASLIWEAVDWSLFDFVGVDHYLAKRIKERYAEMLQPLFATDKPVVITEFGCRTYKGADTSTEGMAGDIADYRPNLRVAFTMLTNPIRTALTGKQLPPPRMQLKPGNYVRDEEMQARELKDQLGVLGRAGVNGTFVMTFLSPTNPYNDDPRMDLDMNSYSLAKSYEHGRHGLTYPDMTWEPKEAFRAVADFYQRINQPGMSS
ncbi:MAG: abortive infection protein [Anaerolineales bacterium]|jgi:hypothetical protein